MKLRATRGMLLLAGVCAYGQTPSPAATGWIEYSNMFVHSETGDILGTDLRLRRSGALYEMILFCGEGVPVGPIRATFTLRANSVVLRPLDTMCGEKISLKLADQGIDLKIDLGKWELIPRHKNYLKEDRWK